MYTDIKLDDNLQPSPAASGDAVLVSEIEELIQEIKLEAMTQEGELFFDETYGWSLLDFIQRDHDELYEIELKERAKTKLSRHDVIDTDSIEIKTSFVEDIMNFLITFKIHGDSTTYSIPVSLSRINVEVTND